MGRGRSNRVWAALLFAMATLAHAGAGHAQTLEYAVKANYLVRFAVFVEWPSRAFASPEAPVVICVTGRDPFGAALTDAAGAHTAGGRPIVPRALRDADRVAGCHMVYVGAATPGDIIAAVERTRGVLMITDQAVSAGRGAIHFAVVSGRVRFHIDNDAAIRAGLNISSRLLSLALSVREDAR